MGLAAIVLGAGASSRMGQPKQLLPIDGTPMIRHVCDAVSGADFTVLCCVVGAHRDAIATAVPQQFELIESPDWALGLGHSIQAGIQFVSDREAVDGAFLFLADQPFIRTHDILQMITLHAGNPELIIATTYDSGPGVPAIFPRKYFPMLMAISGDKGAKALLTRLGAEVLQFHHQGTVDIDTRNDYEGISEELQ